VWEVVLTYGVSPITVAGPWPILTAFPTSQTCKLSNGSLRRAVSGVNSGQRAEMARKKIPQEKSLAPEDFLTRGPAVSSNRLGQIT
jgi:hypothetical protein